ncbi:MAG: RING finger domain-containing protein [Chryseobacterium sp.]
MQAQARPIVAGFRLPYPLVPPAPEQETPRARGSYKLSSETPNFDCPVCLNEINTPENKIMTSCNHAFCGECVSRLQHLAGDNACIKCPMCRLSLTKTKPPVVPLEKIPLAKIRKLLADQNRTIESLHYQINNAPNRIASHIQTINNIMRVANNAHLQLASQLREQTRLQEQVMWRARPRRQVGVQVEEEIIIV